MRKTASLIYFEWIQFSGRHPEAFLVHQEMKQLLWSHYQRRCGAPRLCSCWNKCWQQSLADGEMLRWSEPIYF